MAPLSPALAGLSEEIFGGANVRAGGEIDFPFMQPFQDFIGGQVDQFNVVGGVEHGIRHGFLDPYARRLRHHIA